MSPQQWQTIEKALADLTLDDKLELITRMVQTIRTDVSASPDRDRDQRRALDALHRKLDALPTSPVADGLCNRDQVLYGSAS